MVRIPTGSLVMATLQTAPRQQWYASKPLMSLAQYHSHRPLTQVVMLRAKGVCSVSAGSRHSVAVSVTGVVYCWGNGDSGQLALKAGTLGNTPWPTAIPFLIGLNPALVRHLHAHSHLASHALRRGLTHDSSSGGCWRLPHCGSYRDDTLPCRAL